MKLSFIVVTYHRTEPLQACLNSIYSQRELPLPCEIIIVDNGGDAVVSPSPDPRVTLTIERPKTNLGVTGGRNLGMQQASGDYLVFIDDDATWHRPDDAARLIAHLDADPQLGAVAVQVIDPSDQSVIVNLLPTPDKKRALSATVPFEVPYFYGGGHILRAEAIRRIGGYTERFFYAMEEIDLCLRLIDADYKIVYDPAVAVYHQRSTSVVGNAYWVRNALNKSRVAWRLLPYPYPLTVLTVWSAATLIKTRSLNALMQVWRALWAERALLAQERKPIRVQTVRYLKRIGARLTY